MKNLFHKNKQRKTFHVGKKQLTVEEMTLFGTVSEPYQWKINGTEYSLVNHGDRLTAIAIQNQGSCNSKEVIYHYSTEGILLKVYSLKF